MSICVCIQNERGLILGADTAVTDEINGVLYRRREQFVKVRKIGDFVIFGSGMVGIMNEVYTRFNQCEAKTIEALREIVIQCCDDFKQAYPQLYERKPEITRDVAVFASTMEGGKAVSYVMTPHDNFNLNKLITPPGRSIPHVGGYYADEASDYVGNLIRNGMHADKAIIQTIRHFSGAYVGGDIILVKLDESGIQVAPPIPTLETVSIPYYGGGHLYGSTFRTNVGGYPYCEISSTDNIFKAAKSANSYYEIVANPGSYASPVVYHTDGTAMALTGMMGGGYFSLVSGGDYDIGASDGTLRLSADAIVFNSSNISGIPQSAVTGLAAKLNTLTLMYELLDSRLMAGGL